MTTPNSHRDHVRDPRGATAASFADFARASLDLVGNVIGNVDRIVGTVREDGAAIASQTEAVYRFAASRFGSARDLAGATPRMLRIVREGMSIIAAYRIHRARARYLSEERASVLLERLHRRSAQRLFRLCVDLRGGVLKLGQFFSCRMDLLPAAYVEELSALQDRVPAVAADALRGRIESELGESIDELFASFEDAPIAAASLAQVHRAVLHDGRAVAVKIQVPGIDEVIDSDLAALRFLASAAGDLVPQMDLSTICTELSRSVRRELDFAAEAVNLREFRDAFDGDDDVLVPELHEVFSTERVLTMELIEGVRLTDYLDAAKAADRARLFEIMLRCFCQQILEDGLFHADPHPGNFLVLPGPKLVLLDFGSVAHISPQKRRAYASVVGAALARDAAEVARQLAELGFATRDRASDTLVSFAELMLESFREDAMDLSDIDPQAQLARALELARTNPVVQVPTEFVMLGRVFGSLGGMLMHYAPDVDLFAIIAPHLARAFLDNTA